MVKPTEEGSTLSTVFTKIINGELPGRFVWRDETAVAFLTIGPITPGHTLVVPREEIDQWTDAPDDLLNHLTVVGKRIGEAQKAVWNPPRIGLIVAGFEVPHLHLHVLPTWTMGDFDFTKANNDPDPAELDANAEKLRKALTDLGYGANVPTE